MKLLDKHSVNRDIQDQRHSQMEEGVRLAKKIDALRETLASLEQQHAEFLVSSQARYKEMMGPLERRIATLQGEVTKLEERRAQLMLPLDQEWEDLDEAKAQHEQNALSLVSRETSFQAKEDELVQRERGISFKESRLTDSLTVMEHDRGIIATEKEKTLALSAKTEEERRQFVEDTAQREAVLVKKEEDNNRWANALDRRDRSLDVREKDLNDKERAINDKFAQLERTITRIKK